MSPRFGDDKRRVVRRDRHAVREHDVVSDLTRNPIGRHERDRSGPEVLLTEGEADFVDVDVAAAVDGDLVPALAERAEIGVGDKRSVGLAAQEPVVAGHQQPAIR